MKFIFSISLALATFVAGAQTTNKPGVPVLNTPPSPPVVATYYGIAVPNGSLTAGQGAIYIQNTNGIFTQWVKTNNTGNTGWGIVLPLVITNSATVVNAAMFNGQLPSFYLPATGGSAVGLTNTNMSVLSSKYLPQIFTGTGLLCPVGNNVNLFTNTLSYGTTNLHIGDNIVVWNGPTNSGAGAQFEIVDIPDGKTLRVFELVQTNTSFGGGAIIASNSWYQVYANAANLWDVNGEQADYTGHTHGGIASDGGFFAAAGAFRTGWSFGYRFMGATNNARMTLAVLGTRGPVMDFQAGGNGNQGDPFYWSLWAPYESLGVMSNGWVAARSGFTNNFAPSLTFNVVTNQFGDGNTAILRGPDSNFQTVLREGGNRWNNYYAFGDVWSGGGGHKFTSRGGGADKTELTVATDYINAGVPLMFEGTNFSGLNAFGFNHEVVLINSNQVMYLVSSTKTNLLMDMR